MARVEMNPHFLAELYAPGGAVDRDMDARANRVLAQQVATCPVELGRLRSSLFIDSYRDEQGRPVRRIGSNLDYVLFVVLGTGLWGPKRQRIKPKTKKALWWPGAAHPVASVAGQRPQPFIQQSLEAAR